MKQTSELSGSKRKVGYVLLKYNTVFIFILLLIVSSVLSSNFLTMQNVLNVLRQQASVVCISLSMLLVLLTGGIDLSSGSMAAVGGLLAALMLSQWGFVGAGTEYLVILIVIIAGCAVGAVIGFLVAKMKMPAFIVTLAFMTIGRGIAYMLTEGQPIRLDGKMASSEFFINLGKGQDPLLNIPWTVLIYIVLIVVFALVMKYTAFGRLVIATGSNEEAVRLSGINVDRYKIAVYMISSAMAMFAGILIMSRAAIGTPSAGDGAEMDAIAACVIGGASLSGGKGKVGMTIVGVLTLALIGNIMNLMSIASYPQQVIKGFIIIGAVLLQNINKKKGL